MNAACFGMRKTIRPMVLRLFLTAIVLYLGSASPAAAESFTTECPKNYPDAHEKILQSAQMLHGTDGSWAAGDREMILENGLEHWIERHPKDQWWFHRAVLRCAYGPSREGPELRLPVPGVLREYHILIKPPWTPGCPPPSDKDTIFVRAWAVSAADPISES